MKTRKINRIIKASVAIFLAVMMVQCNNQATKSSETDEITNQEKEQTVTISKTNYGTTPDGEEVLQFKMKNKLGMEIEVITYGGIITKWTAPDKNGNYTNIVLGFDNLEQYIKETPYFGAIIGRYGNRIDKGQFELDGVQYQLDVNDGANHLHGGFKGFDKVVWTAEEQLGENQVSLKMTYVSKDGEAGYPGTLTSTVVYTLTDDNVLEVTYDAFTDKKTIVNLTQHSYFNLSGDFSETILDHDLMIDADAFIPVDGGLIPTGELRAVEGTPFDFRTAKVVGQDIEEENEQLTLGKGFDHCWVLNHQNSYRKVAAAYHSETGRLLEIYTDEPGIQFYSGNFLDGTLPMPQGGTYAHRTGFCLETQHYPDSPNQADFPSVVLNPGEQYHSKTAFKFSTK